jgi:hypothetical protein
MSLSTYCMVLCSTLKGVTMSSITVQRLAPWFSEIYNSLFWYCAGIGVTSALLGITNTVYVCLCLCYFGAPCKSGWKLAYSRYSKLLSRVSVLYRVNFVRHVQRWNKNVRFRIFRKLFSYFANATKSWISRTWCRKCSRMMTSSFFTTKKFE